MNARITRIVVHKLFNKFDYELDLDNGYDISILIAPNGCGKTTILNILNFMLHPTRDGFEKIISVPFELFACYFSDENETGLRLEPHKGGLLFNIDYKDGGHTIEINSDSIDALANNSEDNLKKYKPISVFKESFRRLLGEMRVNYIPANRLFTINKSGEAENLTLKMNKDVQDKFKNIFREYNDRQSQAKDAIVDRFLNTDNDIYTDNKIDTDNTSLYEEVKKDWKLYYDEVKDYRNLGLIDSTYGFTDSMLKKANNVKLSFMKIYTQEFSKTLEPVKDFYTRLKLFVDILNERNKITGKKFSFSKDEGIVLNVDKKQIPLEFMSSGEKNDFVMFYNLIFNSAGGGLVLIDEPEISLHIEWQETFLDKMFNICEMNKLQAIVATHSPHIVYGRDELLINGGRIL